MTFNPENAYKHVENLSFPRTTGSSGEKKARDYISDYFKSLGLKTESQEFTYSTFPLGIMARLFLLFLMFLEVLIYVFYENHPFLSVIISLMVVFLIISSTKWRESYHSLYNIPWKIKTSWNLIARDMKEGARKNLIFLAHYDSKSQTLPAFWRAILFGSSLTGSSSLIGLATTFAILKFLNWQLPVWDKSLLFYLCLVTIISFLLLQLNRSSNLSPGALDNASGIGVLLELAKNLPEELRNTNLTFIATGAEEDGLCGAIRFMEEKGKDYDKQSSFFINFDGPGADGNIIITSSYAIPPIHTGGLLTPLAFKIAKEDGYKTIKGYIPLGAGLDQFPISMYGFPVITISSGKILSKIIFAIHTENDTMELISKKALEQSGNLSYKMAQEIDKYF
jgi:hypothetical protein